MLNQLGIRTITKLNDDMDQFQSASTSTNFTLANSWKSRKFVYPKDNKKNSREIKRKIHMKLMHSKNNWKNSYKINISKE